MLHKETVTPELVRILSTFQACPELASFRLVGGTAVALQVGHRRSLDIDLFSTEDTDLSAIARLLHSKLHASDVTLTDERVTAEVNGVKVEVWDNWTMPFKRPAILSDGIKLAALEDLAAFKLSAMVGRREKKDYVDLFFLFDKLGARKVLEDFKDYDPLISMKSVSFALAEVKTAQENKSPMPDMLMPFDWKLATEKFLSAFKMFREI